MPFRRAKRLRRVSSRRRRKGDLGRRGRILSPNKLQLELVSLLSKRVSRDFCYRVEGERGGE